MLEISAHRDRAPSLASSTVKGWLSSPMVVFGVATALVALRALVYLRFEELAFDSDQAIVGLMAKHLASGRAFPLFFYGQRYMLGVESWAAAPFFLIAGSTVRTLRLSILAWNLAFAFLLLVGLQRDAGLRPYRALAAAVFFLAAPASVATHLMVAQGGIIEPFVYIAVLWFLRQRPLWFGVVLAIGFRNREFTMYAVPVLLLLEMIAGELSWKRVRDWLVAMTTFFAVWELIDAVEPFADLLGPGTRGQLPGVASEFANLVGRFDWAHGAEVDRMIGMGPQLLSWFAGAGQIDTGLPLSDHRWLFWIAALGVLLLAGRLLVLVISSDGVTHAGHPFRLFRRRIAQAPFAFYLLGTGMVAALTFVAAKPFLNGYARYALLTLLMPVGLTAAVLALETRRFVAGLVMTLLIGWGTMEVADHAQVLAFYLTHPPPNTARQVADRLVAERVSVARAGYWRAYLVTFLSGERVRVASNDFIRIQEYQDLFYDRSSDAVSIADEPCPGGRAVGTWYLCPP